MSILKDPLYQTPFIPYQNFPITVARQCFSTSKQVAFNMHHHTQQELIYIANGKLKASINGTEFVAGVGDLLIVNNNELHSAVTLHDKTEYVCIILELSFLKSCTNGDCELKYFTPIDERSICFNNHIPYDKKIANYIDNILNEYKEQKVGYEIAIKAEIYRLYVALLRDHVKESSDVKLLTKQLYATRMLAPVFAYIFENYNKDILGYELCRLVNLSKYYFHHLFKNATGKSPVKYINSLRINKAVELLKSTSMPISEIACEVGFDDVNYFSRIFKMEKGMTPRDARSNKTNI